MKRHGNLWDTLVSFENLHQAYQQAIKGKRSRPDVAAFIFNAEAELITLWDELRCKTYQPSPYRTFHVYEEKKRLISAAPIRDRVVHHTLCNVLEPVFEKRFIFDLYSNRKGKGQHQAVTRAQRFANMFPYVLKCDIKKYFPTIDHGILKQTLRRKIKCRATLWLADLIIDHSNPQIQVDDYFPGDQLDMPLERRKGLPIGNQTSQFFANLYLDPLDHFVKEVLRVRGYLRYVDDFLLFGSEKRALWQQHQQIEEFLNADRLKLNPNASHLYRVCDSFPFLGYRVFPAVILVKRAAILRFRRRVKHVRALRRAGKVPLSNVKCFVFGCMGHFAQATSTNLRKKLLRESWF